MDRRRVVPLGEREPVRDRVVEEDGDRTGRAVTDRREPRLEERREEDIVVGVGDGFGDPIDERVPNRPTVRERRLTEGLTGTGSG